MRIRLVVTRLRRSRGERVVVSSAAFQPRLRLVGGEDDDHCRLSSRADSPALDPDELAVVKENRLAAHAGPIDGEMVDARDPRWVLAMQTKSRLQGAMLTPERRDELLASGRKLGLRPFESNLVIAVVQDQARQEHPVRQLEPTIGVIGVKRTPRKPTARRERESAARWLVAAIGAAIALAAVIIRWLLEPH